MLFLRSFAFLSIFLPVLSVAQLEIAGCKSYEPASVSLHGTLLRSTFAGPPNYEDIRKGDKVETSWLLKLDSPICVVRDRANPDLNPSQKNVRKVQLVLNKNESERADALLGKRIVATGTLFGDKQDTTILRYFSRSPTSTCRTGNEVKVNWREQAWLLKNSSKEIRRNKVA